MGRHERDERGQATILIVGFAVMLAMAVAVVVDATQAYLQRQGLSSLADGAALHGADLGATGREVYEGGLTQTRLELTTSQAREAVAAYLHDTGAYRDFPGLTYVVRIDPQQRRVVVTLRAPLDLPLTMPGSPDHPSIRAEGAAAVTPE